MAVASPELINTDDVWWVFLLRFCVTEKSNNKRASAAKRPVPRLWQREATKNTALFNRYLHAPFFPPLQSIWFSLFNYGRMMMYAALIRHEWEMKGRWDLDKWLPLFHQSDRSPSICSNLNDNKILNCFVLAGHFLHDKQPGKVTLSCNPDSQRLLRPVIALN